MGDIFNKLRNNKLFWLVIGGLSVIIPIIGSMNYHKIFCDSSYYLVMIERIAEGYVPYKTIALGYSPLWLYMMAGLRCLFGLTYGCFFFYLAWIYVAEIIGAYFLFRICESFGSCWKVSFLCACLYIVTLHWCQGNCVMLEPPAIMFGLAAVRYVLYFKDKRSLNFLWIGIIATCSFLCKQFGFGFFFLCVFLIIFYSCTQKGAKGLYFVVGYLIPIAICYIIWGESFNNVIFSDYGTPTTISEKMVFCAERLGYYCVRIVPAVLLSMFFISALHRSGLLVPYIFCILGIGGFVLQYAFTGPSLHYSMFMVPFGLIVISLVSQLEYQKTSAKIAYACLIVSSILMSYSSTYYKRVYQEYIKGEGKSFVRDLDKEIDSKVREQLKPGDTVWISNAYWIHLYYTANLFPPDMASFGYSFIMPNTKHMAIIEARNADWVLFDKGEEVEGDELTEFITSHPSVCIDGNSLYMYHISD